MATFKVGLQESHLLIFDEDQKNINIDINNEFIYDKLLYVAGTPTPLFIRTLKMKDTSINKNINQLLKLVYSNLTI